MKIAYVLNEYPSLSETFIAREIEALRRRGFEIDVWALRAGEGARQIPQLSAAQCLVKPLKKISSAAREKYYRHLGAQWAQLEKEKLAGVQHIHSGWASFPAWIANGAAGVLGVPWSFFGHARDLWVEGESLDAKLATAKFASCCTRVGTEYLRSLAPDAASKVLYAPHGIEIFRYRFHNERQLHDPVRLLAVGRLVEKKGFDVLLKAIFYLNESSTYSRREYSLILTIIGDGLEYRKLEKLSGQYGLQNCVEFRGAQPYHEVIAAMQESDLFVMPSTQARDGDRDGLPNVLLEAAAVGLPIVSTRAGSITDFLDESCAWLCAPNSAAELANAMQSAMGNYDESLRRARNARTRVEEKFDIEKNIEILTRAFEDYEPRMNTNEHE